MASSSAKRLDRLALAWRRCPTHPSIRLECNGGARWTGSDAEWEELETRFLRPYVEPVEVKATRAWCACGRRLICHTCWTEAAKRVEVPEDLAMMAADMPRFHELMDLIEPGSCERSAHAL